LRLRDLLVRDRDLHLLERLEARRAEADLGHGAELIADRHAVAESKRAIPEERESRQQVGERLLRRETDREAGDADAREQRAEVDPHLFDRDQRAERENREPYQRQDELRQRGIGLRAVEELAQEPHHQPRQEPEEAEENETRDDAGQMLAKPVGEGPAEILG